MKKVQAALNEHFSTKPLYRGLMSMDYLLYGGGLLFLFIGSVFSFTGTSIFATIGMFALLAGLVFAFAKKDEIGLLISFGGYAVISFAEFIIAFVRVFTFNAAFLTIVFSKLIQTGVGVLFFFLTLNGMEKYIAYRERQRARAAAQAAAYAQAAVQAAPQPVYAPPAAPPAAQPTVPCTACGAPISPDAVFCTKCGAKQEPKQESKPANKTCPSCGAELPEEALFCVKCGAKL